jgi:hypothetical protein
MLVSMISDMATRHIAEEGGRMSGDSKGNKSSNNVVKNSVIPDDGQDTFSADDFLASVEGMSKEEAEAAFAGLTSDQQEEVMSQVDDINVAIKLLPPEFQEAIESAMMSLFQMPILQELLKDA